MSFEHEPNKLYLYGIPLVFLVASALWGISRIGKSSSPADGGVGAEILPTQTAPLSDEFTQSQQSSPLARSGVIHPYTGVFYPSAIPPTGYENWDCFSIPAGGTSYGSILVGGSDPHTTSDTREAIIFKNGFSYPFPADSDPNTWPGDVWIVPPGAVGCSR